MNHLCGLPNLSFDQGGNLNEEERNVLIAFRNRYDRALFGKSNDSCNNLNDPSSQSDEDEDEEKRDYNTNSPQQQLQLRHDGTTSTSTHSNSKQSSPTYEISQDHLPESGLRPLDDYTLYRYLLADRQTDGAFDVDASYQRLIAALRFRKESQCDVIVKNVASFLDEGSSLPSKIQTCQRLRVGIWAGTDFQNQPVVFERLGQFFGSGNISSVSQEDWMKYYLYFLEMHFAKMREAAKRSGKMVNRIVYFADFQGVVSSILNGKIWKVVPLLKALVKTVECHYPEVVVHITLFNVPRVASAAYNVVKGFLDPVTADKIELFPGVPYDRFKEMMSDEVIPEEYGGKNKIDYPKTAKK